MDPSAVRCPQKDDLDEVTPLYFAVLNRNTEAAKMLIEAGADTTIKCNGNTALHCALALGAHPALLPKCRELTELLLGHPKDLLTKDDRGDTCLHVAASLGLAFACTAILAADPATLELKDRTGARPLHAAAARGHMEVVALLLAAKAEAGAAASLGETPLHAAVSSAHWDVARALLAAGAPPLAQTKRGLNPAQVAQRRGVSAPPQDLAAALEWEDSSAGTTTTAAGPGGAKTLLVTHPLCLEHHTCELPMRRVGDGPPPENVRRLRVLVDRDAGSLRTGELAAATEWCEEAPRAKLADVLRVHESGYVAGLQAACSAVTEGKVGALDGDTAVSAQSFEAAMRAAGAVCHAIDRVCSGEYRNAFCAVRPPGHHAGFRGVVETTENADGKHGSAGFCLLNNVSTAWLARKQK